MKVTEGIFKVGAYFDLLFVPLCLVSGNDDSCHSNQAGFVGMSGSRYMSVKE